MLLNWLNRLYTSLLCLYPRDFQAEFGEEMQDVFRYVLLEASAKGRLALLQTGLVELMDLPRAYWMMRAQAETNPSQAWPDNPVVDRSWRELACALAVFLLPAGMILINQPADSHLPISLLVALMFVGIMIAMGWLGGVSLWSLPYIGIILVVAGYLVLFQWVVNLVTPALIVGLPPGPWDAGTALLIRAASHGMLWLMLFCMTLLIIAILGVFNRVQPFLKRIRHDWTLLSYVLYGESIFALLMLYESHRFHPIYSAASLLCLLAGIWFYLRSSTRTRRMLVLLGCLTLAIGVASLDRSLLTATQTLGPRLNGLPTPLGRLFLSWAWMVIVLSIPGFLARRTARHALFTPGSQPGS
jgi:hypothetical protein